MLDSAVHWLEIYAVDKAIIAFPHPMDSGLSGGQHYPMFEQLNRGLVDKILGNTDHTVSMLRGKLKGA